MVVCLYKMGNIRHNNDEDYDCDEKEHGDIEMAE
jgi:hypothetical protein